MLCIYALDIPKMESVEYSTKISVSLLESRHYIAQFPWLLILLVCLDDTEKVSVHIVTL